MSLMARNGTIVATIVCAALTAPAASAQVPSAATVDCGDAIVSLTCAELVPTPDLRQVRARLTLSSPSSPFGVSVTADGRPLMRAAVDIDGLPDPATLGGGGHRAYVAWLTTLTMSHETRLGEVKNGHTELGTIDLLQYRVVISAEAEASADVKERRGRLVLRATSPSSRLLVHRDMLSPAAPGALRDAPPSRRIRARSGLASSRRGAGAGAGTRARPWLGDAADERDADDAGHVGPDAVRHAVSARARRAARHGRR